MSYLAILLQKSKVELELQEGDTFINRYRAR